MPEEEIDNIFEAGAYPYQVRERLLTHMAVQAEGETARSIANYEAQYANVERNWREKGKKHTMPPLPVVITVDTEKAQYVFSPAPGYPLPEPWTVEPDVEWGDESPEFGPPIPGTGAFYVTGAGGANGDKRQRDGKTYRLLVIGERGAVVYVRMWVPE